MRENRNFVVPVNILTPVCARPGLLGLHNTLPCVLIANNIEWLWDGSYRAHFAWKDNHPPLLTNFSTNAHRTTLNPSLLTKYNEILADQEHHGFIERIQDPISTAWCHYIPHHAVRKDSPTTPARIVCDCSCHQARNQPSLNDSLLTGQPMANSMISVVSFKISITSSWYLHGHWEGFFTHTAPRRW